MQLNEFKSKRPSLFGYLFAAIIGAIIGGFLLLIFGPSVLFERFQTIPQAEIGKAHQVQQAVPTPVIKNTVAATEDVNAAANAVIPCVVGIASNKLDKTELLKGSVSNAGSGIIIDSAGYILTNSHIAKAGAKNLIVSLYDGTETKGHTVWAEPEQDISIIKVDKGNLNAAAIGDSTSIKIGQEAYAVGNPIGLKFDRSLSSGIISSINRTIQIGDKDIMEDLLQTTASINTGNSGGPLINASGEVIGINTVKAQTPEGMGYAVPINRIKPVLNIIKKTGSFETPDIGITAFDKEIAGYLNSNQKSGIYIYDVERKSPAKKAGLKKGDVIISVNNQSVNTLTDLSKVLYTIGVGNDAQLKIKTSGNEDKTVTVHLK